MASLCLFQSQRAKETVKCPRAPCQRAGCHLLFLWRRNSIQEDAEGSELDPGPLQGAAQQKGKLQVRVLPALPPHLLWSLLRTQRFQAPEHLALCRPQMDWRHAVWKLPERAVGRLGSIHLSVRLCPPTYTPLLPTPAAAFFTSNKNSHEEKLMREGMVLWRSS